MSDLSRLLNIWRAEPSVGGNIADWRTLPARPASVEPLPDELHPALERALAAQGIRSLFTHQANAWQAAQAGHNLALVTGTASGKTLAYHLPVLDRLLRQPAGRALFLYPTKALAQDQLAALQKLLAHTGPIDPPLPAAIYDGDTPSRDRPAIRRKARLVFTNPDMLHTGILPHHTSWAEFFAALQFIVIDEMHIYRGVFGSHFANVLRRLTRIARHYGAHPQVLLTSATIANPQELAQRLVEAPVTLVDQDGSSRGPRHFLIYNPPVVDADLGLRRSALQESVRLASDLLAYDLQTILFGRSRRTVELLLHYLREQASAAQTDPAKVRGYRSGYLPAERREIERGLRSGEVRAVAATNALELGIDIGGLHAALLVGYPGSIAATWQQAGRAGRGDDPALSLLVTTADPLDQFLAHHPEYFFARSPEQALINPDNLLILLDHLRCAAFELPFQAGEAFGAVPAEQVAEFIEFLVEAGELHASGDKFFWMADRYPAGDISLRSASAERIQLQSYDTGEADPPRLVGQVDLASAHFLTHPGAVYMHEGQTYLVDDLDLEGLVARLRPADPPYYTMPQMETQVQLLELGSQESVRGGEKAHGELLVTTQLVGYRMVRWFTHENLGQVELSLPPSELQTTGYWFSLAPETVDRLREAGLWRSDPIRYGPAWKGITEQVRARDGYRCQICGAPEKGKAHDVHHVTPFRTFLSVDEANRPENLVTLCPPCHHRAETAVRVRSGLSGLAFVLSHLAPFSLMCDSGDLGVHADPQSPLAGGQPAVVLYDRIPAGIGFSLRLFEIHAELLAQAKALVAACECADGCPSCVGPGGESGLGGKRESLAILEAMV